jgi:hypothetical protein
MKSLGGIPARLIAGLRFSSALHFAVRCVATESALGEIFVF